MAQKVIPRVTAGDRIKPFLTARNFNAYSDAANWVQTNRHANTDSLQSSQSNTPPSVAWIVNNDGTAFEKNHVAGLGNFATETSEIANRLKYAIEGEEPTVASHVGKFAVLRDPLLTENSYGNGTVSGLACVTLFVPTNGAWITRAEVDDQNATRLAAHPGGSAQILWKDTSGGTENVEMEAIVRLGNPQNVSVLGVAAGTIPAGGTGTVTCYSDDTTDTGFQVVAWHNWMDSGQPISDTKKVIITWFPDQQKWRVTHAECEDAATSIGQLSDDASYVVDVTGTDIDGSSTSPIIAYDATQELATADVIVNSLAGTIQVPDIPVAGRLFRFSFNAAVTAPSNNTTLAFFWDLNGIAQTPPAFQVSVQNASNTQTIATSFYAMAVQQSSPVIRLSIAADSNGNVTMNNRTFSITGI